MDDPSDSSLPPWSFSDARTRRVMSAAPEARSRPARHYSLPQTPLASASSSIFGSTSMSHPGDEQSEGPSSLAPSRPPLSTLPSRNMRDVQYEDQVRETVERRRIPQIKKDTDDPTTPPAAAQGNESRELTTFSTLSRLFTVQTSPEVSRQSSYLQPAGQSCGYTRNLQTTDVAALPAHLYSRGLLEGRHSDIIVHAFGHQYKLHRLILDRAPFFASAFSEPWLEANAKDITVHPEDIDPSITQSSFELALKRLYGCGNVHEEDGDAVGLFATGCWLEIQDLINSSIESMLRQMTPRNLGSLIKLVTRNYYGRAGDKILASAKAMLCRDGWKMPLKYWDDIPGDIVREIVGGDGFFIDGEWDRWVLAKRILDRRLRARAIDASLVEQGTRRKVRKAPESIGLMAVRFDGVYRKTGVGSARATPASLQAYIALYTHPSVEPILVLMDEGIHYVHLDFEQLQLIRRARDSIGLPIMPEKVISNALWQQMELRQKIMNSREVDMELDLSTICAEDMAGFSTSRDTTMSITTPSEPPNSKGKGKSSDAVSEEAESEMDSGSWDGNGRARKFWIPSSDCNIVMGGSGDPVIATPNNLSLHQQAQRLSATLQPEDVQWAADFAAITSRPRPTNVTTNGQPSHTGAEVRYTHFPPFRFSAEFPNPKLLKDRKRVYSRTVFYAGSLWNIYIQKVESSRSKQLGVYLHRAKERETEEVVAGTAGLARGSVDERIGQLEREMIVPSERRERRQRRRTVLDADDADGAESSGSAGDPENTVVGAAGDIGSARASTMRNLLARGAHGRKAGQRDIAGSLPSATSCTFPNGLDGLLTPASDSDNSSDDDDFENDRFLAASQNFHVPTLPPYVDARPTIKTYFKIYTPSRGGRMLSVYESAPDSFNFSQSWGWKSSTLMLDEGLMGEGDDAALSHPDEELPVGEKQRVSRSGAEGKGDGKLRFMVVIGNI